MKKLMYYTWFLAGLLIGVGIMFLDIHHIVDPNIKVDHISQPGEKDYNLVEMNVSAYCVCEKCCGDWSDGITASGVPAKGKLIAAPPEYPFGTKMDVPGYGEALVRDRGGLIKGNRLDLLFDSHQEALNWGRQNVTVKVWKDRL